MPIFSNPVEYTILAGGLAQTTDVEECNDVYRIVGTATITVDNTFGHSGALVDGTTFTYEYQAAATYNGGAVKFHGVAMTAAQALKNHRVVATYQGAAWNVDFIPDLSEDAIIDTAKLIDEAVTVGKMADLTRGSILSGQTASNRPAALDAKTSGAVLIGDGTDLLSSVVSGDIAIASTGVATIQAGVIVNADINAAAAIAYSKLASLTSANILVGSAGNVATVTPVTGDVTIDNTGVTTIGAAKVLTSMVEAPLTKDSHGIAISFETGEQANYAWIAPYDGTLTNIYTYVTKAIAATDDATVTANIGAVPVTDGVVTIAASSALNTADSATPSALNTFVDGDLITFVTSKATAGGKAQLIFRVTRT